MKSAAQAALEGDELFERLRDGRATEDDQKVAAKWINWLARFVPQDRYEAKRDGYE